MVSRRRWMGPGLLAAAAAAVSLAFWGLARGRKEQPGAGRKAAVAGPIARDVRPGIASATGAAGSSAGPSKHLPPVPGTEPGTASGAARDRERDGDAPAVGEEHEEADRLLASFGKLARDLEYSPGLPEPRQQAVMPQPEPWRRDPSREGPSPVIDGVAPLRVRAAGGDRVEIRGRNLRVVQVMFGTAPARLLGSSGTLVSVEAPPASAGPVTIAVTNDDGTWAIAQVPVVYVE